MIDEAETFTITKFHLPTEDTVSRADQAAFAAATEKQSELPRFQAAPTGPRSDTLEAKLVA